MKFLGILSLPRSGTTHLCHNILASNGRVVNLGEIFHNLGSAGQRKFIYEFFPSLADFRAAAASKPLETLQLITQRLDADIAVFKVFPDHLDRNVFERLALAIEGFVVLIRNPLSTWVSNRIASETGIWGGQSTDDRSVAWNPADFIEHSIQHLGFLNDRVSFLKEHNVPFLELTYPQISQVGADASGIFDAISTAIPALDGIRLGAEHTASHSTERKSHFDSDKVIFKQDKRIPLLRMQDWQSAVADLERWGLLWLADEGVPFDRVALTDMLRSVPYCTNTSVVS